MAWSVFDLVKDSTTDRQLANTFKLQLTGEQQYRLLVFESYCLFHSICLFTKIKQGCKDSIMRSLRVKLLTGIAEVWSRTVEVPGIDRSVMMGLLAKKGSEAYARLDEATGQLEHVGSSRSMTNSQVVFSKALSSIVLADESSFLPATVVLYSQFMETLAHMRIAYSGAFLVEEGDLAL